MLEKLRNKIKAIFRIKQEKEREDWFSGEIIRGRGLGKKFESPTLNFNNPEVLLGKRNGVYACFLKINGEKYKGLLYYGPRLILGEKKNILEVFVFNFNEEIYGRRVFFKLAGFIRGPKKFLSFKELKKQLKKDHDQSLKILNSSCVKY